MRTSKLSDEQLIEKIAKVFRNCGYMGASLSILSEATGLERASLYHRFPGGKEEMAEAVLTHVGSRLEKELFAPLRTPGDPGNKLVIAVQAIQKFYENGHLPCVLETLSMEGTPPKLRVALAGAATAFLDALAELSHELLAKSPAKARDCAAAALVTLEGALILTRVTGQSAHFDQALRQIPVILTGH